MIKIMFAMAGEQSVIPQGYQNAADLWSKVEAPQNSTAEIKRIYHWPNELLLKFPWPLADQSVGAVKIEYGLENLSGVEDFFKLFNELYRVCADGALVEIKLADQTAVNNLNLPFNNWYFSQEQLRFFDRTYREQVMQHWWGYNPFAEFNANFKEVEMLVQLIKPANELMQEHNLSSVEELKAWLKQHPDAISHMSCQLQAIHDESNQFAMARVASLEPFPLQIYPWDGQHDMWVSQSLLKGHIWEKFETAIFMALLKALLQRPDAQNSLLRIANVGANIGWYTIVSALLNPRIHVDAFEPTPETVNMLRHNVTLNGLDSQVTVYDCAVTDEVGESIFYINSNDAGSNSLMKNDVQHCSAMASKIHVETLEHIYLEQDKSLWPEVLLIDVEGHEQHLFNGASKLFEQGYRPVLVTEFSPILLKLRGECTYYRDLVTKYQYQPYVINKRSNHPADALIKYNLEALEANYQRLADPKQNPKSQFMDVVFVPEWFDPNVLIANLHI